MPYIPESKRKYFDVLFHPESDLTHPGSLNYVFTSFIKAYIERKGGPSYTVYNEVIGVLECCKLEFYRRLVADYEDLKIKENGDVY